MADTATDQTRAQRWGANVMGRRCELEMSQAGLAQRSTTTQQTISRVELGQQKPGDELRVRIAKALTSRVSELFDYEDEA